MRHKFKKNKKRREGRHAFIIPLEFKSSQELNGSLQVQCGHGQMDPKLPLPAMAGKIEWMKKKDKLPRPNQAQTRSQRNASDAIRPCLSPKPPS